MALTHLQAFRLLLFVVLFPSAAAPETSACAKIEEAGVSYAVCMFDARKASIRVFLRGDDGQVYGGFSPLAAALARKGETLVFAMNAGMYGEDLSPIGLYIENGAIERRANTASGAGNFYLKPNGVFWIDGAKAGVTETGRFLRQGLRPPYATQSGPLLLTGGRLNPRIHESGTSAKIRNGVGVRDGRFVTFAISNEPVTFHAFAALFRDRLRCLDALYLDGSVSSLYTPELSRHDRLRPMGPIVGVTEKMR